jgi:glycosyltransferase involved in cell wall biosynthesis
VIPVRDEKENLVPLWHELQGALRAARWTYEIVWVDDGSSDGSREVLRGIADESGVSTVILLDGAHGQTAALDAGFRAARGEVVGTLDADLQSDPADILSMMDSLGTLDALVGYRIRRDDPAWRRLLSRAANAVRNRMLGESIRDTGCSLKLVRRECLARIKIYDGMHRFLPSLLMLEGFRVAQIGVGHRPRRKGRSKYGPTSRLLGPVLDLLAVRWMKTRKLAYRAAAFRGKETERNSRVG